MSSKHTPMTPEAASRIQGATDRGSTPADGFKERAQRAAAENGKAPHTPAPKR